VYVRASMCVSAACCLLVPALFSSRLCFVLGFQNRRETAADLFACEPLRRQLLALSLPPACDCTLWLVSGLWPVPLWLAALAAAASQHTAAQYHPPGDFTLCPYTSCACNYAAFLHWQCAAAVEKLHPSILCALLLL
jgi:hypothetical protein